MDESRFRVGYYSSEKEGTIAIDLDDLQQVLNAGYGSYATTTARSAGSVSIVRRKTAPFC